MKAILFPAIDQTGSTPKGYTQPSKATECPSYF